MALNQTVPLDSRVVVFGPRYQNPCKVPFWTQQSLIAPCSTLTVLSPFSTTFPRPIDPKLNPLLYNCVFSLDSMPFAQFPIFN